MKKVTIDSLPKLKKKYPALYTEIKEKFSSNGKKLSNFEVDYFHYDGKKHTFFLTLSSGISEDLEIFDANGEMIDDEVSIHNASFDRTVSKEDFFDSDNNFVREMLDENDHDIEY